MLRRQASKAGRRYAACSARSPGPTMILLMRLLIVEDDKGLCRVLEKGFEEEGFDVRCAGDGQQGLELALAAFREAFITKHGVEPDTWSVIAGELPLGLELEPDTGEIVRDWSLFDLLDQNRIVHEFEQNLFNHVLSTFLVQEVEKARGIAPEAASDATT